MINLPSEADVKDVTVRLHVCLRINHSLRKRGVGYGREERELARTPQNFEYPRSNFRRKMLIGGD